MLKRFLILTLFLTRQLSTFADASPKFSEQVTIRLVDENSKQLQLDSICVIIPGWKTEIATLHYSTEDFWTGPTLKKEGNDYLLFTHQDLKSFIVIAFVNSQRVKSTLLPRYFGNKQFDFRLENNKLVDVSSFFHASWYSYFVSLFITLLVEVLLGLIFFFKHSEKKRIKRYLMTFILINVLTHFSLWLVYSNTYIPILFLELLVVFIESIYWKVFLKTSYLKGGLISLLTNFVSWIIGAILINFI